MKTYFSIISALVLVVQFSTAQLANGSIAPNFNLTDINGVTHKLYDYLDAGKTVYIDFFAAHCPYCWDYKNTGAMEGLYNQYGPTGTINQDVIILAIEHDPNNGANELNGISGNTKGNWVAELPYPIINPEGAVRTQIIADYKADFYPLIYGICSDRKIKHVGTLPTEGLYAYHTNTCKKSAAIGTDMSLDYPIRFDMEQKSLVVNTTIDKVSLLDMTGKIVKVSQLIEEGNTIDLNELKAGVYFVHYVDSDGMQSIKISIQ